VGVKHWLAEHPFTTCAAWLIVTCYGWGALFGVLGVEMWAALFFGVAWSLFWWAAIDSWAFSRRDQSRD